MNLPLNTVNLGEVARILTWVILLSRATVEADTLVLSDPSGEIISITNASGSAPALISQPVAAPVSPGRLAGFSVNAVGSVPLYYQWYFNNSSIPKATNDSLVIPQVTATEAGSYFAIVANSFGSVTSVVAQLQLDVDGDGLADAWEIANFGSITNQNAVMDFDADGNSNLTEFRDGTSATNKSELLPRLILRSIGGDVLVAPNEDHYNLGDSITLTALPYPGLSFLCWAGDLSGSNSSTNLVMNTNKFVQATFGLPLAAVLDVTNVFTTGGDGGWYGQTNDSHDGISAARTAPIVKHTAAGSTSWMQTTVKLAKDGTVSFWWRSDTADNYVEFVVDNNRVFNTTRELFNVTPWVYHTSYLSAGAHTLNWTYHHAADGSSLDTGYAQVPQDSAFVDRLVITEYADPNLDSDGDGLPDLWEYLYFDQIGYGPNDDPDADGVNNLTEYGDGTIPTRSSSVDPRLTYVIEGGGTAVATPNLAKYNYGQTITNTATPVSGWEFITWRGPFLTQTAVTTKTNNPSAVELLTSQTVRAIFGLPLAEVTDQPGLSWTRGGELGWYGETNVTRDGISAARSAPLSSTGESWMETTVQGPGTLSFWWKVDSTTNVDQLSFLLNTNTQPGGISGLTDWQQQTYFLAAGPQTLRWRFKRNNGTDTNRLAAAWVDQVDLSTGNTVPLFVLQPVDQTTLQLSNVTVQVLARGTPTILYQLYHGSTAYGQPTNSPILIISNPPPALAGSWTVQASNPGGVTTSDPFTLTVIPAPPPNDNFANKFTLDPVTIAAGYTFGATKEPGEPNHSGQTGGDSVWWSWIAPQSGKFRAVAQATNLNDVLLVGVYSGSSVSALTPLGITSFNSSNTPSGDQVQSADDIFDATSGASYSIAVDTSLASGAWFGLWVEYLPPPPNDLFANRAALLGASASGISQLRTATAEPGEPAHDGFPAANSVWWTWTAPQSGSAVVSATSSAIIPRAVVYTGSALASLHQVVGGIGGGTNFETILKFTALAGTSYQIVVDSFFGSVGDVQINVALTTPSFVSPTVDPQGNLNFPVAGPAGASFTIQSSNDFQSWATIYTGEIPATGMFDFQTAIPLGNRERFYRVRSP